MAPGQKPYTRKQWEKQKLRWRQNCVSEPAHGEPAHGGPGHGEQREQREQRELREQREQREQQEQRERREQRQQREPREPREPRKLSKLHFLPAGGVTESKKKRFGAGVAANLWRLVRTFWSEHF